MFRPCLFCMSLPLRLCLGLYLVRQVHVQALVLSQLHQPLHHLVQRQRREVALGVADPDADAAVLHLLRAED